MVKYFSVFVTHPDFPDERQIWVPLSEQDIKAYQEFVANEHTMFCAAYPEDEDNKELFQDWLDDAFAEADFWIELPNARNPVPAHVVLIDLDHPKVEE